jgi:hypothetical protein
MKNLLLFTMLAAAAIPSTQAAILITEVDPTGSSNSNYLADWFELTDTGTTAVNISGWKMDDNSDSYSVAVALKGVTSIAPGQSVVFIEDTNAKGSDSALATSFENTWFGAGNVPAGFTIGFYGGSGVGLGSSGDAVNIFNSSGTAIAGVVFGASTDGVTFDNSAGLNSTTDSVTISQTSVAGVNGAFVATDGEVGSPGVVPEPSSWALLVLGGLGAGLALRARRKSFCV